MQLRIEDMDDLQFSASNKFKNYKKTVIKCISILVL